MARPLPPAEMDFPGSDSFLDVVTNIVGILIILVVVVGARARNAAMEAPPSAKSSGPPSGSDALGMIERDVARSLEQAAALEGEIESRSVERTVLGTTLAAAQNELSQRRGALDAAARKQFDARRRVAMARADLDRLHSEKSRVEAIAGPTVTVASYSTPISRMVEGKEAHFQIKQGRIAYIPLEDLLVRFRTVAREKAVRLQNATELVDTVGPAGGFRLRYMLERVEVAPEGLKAGGSYAALTRWELVQVPGPLGEIVSVALSDQSDFRDRLKTLHPHQWTITLWSYADSFAEFREVRKELYRLGYTVAARPLPEGVPIGGSPKGSRSAAQ